MATINEITGAASYRGDPALGGGVAGGITIDPSPIQRLATFKFYRDRDLFEVKQNQDKEAAKQIAEITAFDISSPLTPYRESLKSQLDDIQKFIRENPDALVYGRNPEKFQQLHEKENKFNTLRKSATASDAIYTARKNAIDKEADPKKRDLEQRRLDLEVKKHFQNGVDAVLGTPLKTAPDIKPDDYKIPDANVTSFDVLAEGPNAVTTTQFKVIDINGLRARSEFLASGVGKQTLDENTARFKSLSPEEQQIEREEAAMSSSKRQQMTNMSGELTGLLNQYKAAHPDADLTQITGDVTGTDTLMDIIKSANNYNKQIQEVNTLIKAGQYKDPTGKVITTQFDPININDGLSPGELIFMNALQNAKTPILSALDKTITETDDANQAAQRAVQMRGQNLDLLNSREGREAAKTLQSMKGTTGEGAEIITDVAEYMLGHIQRVSATMKAHKGTIATVELGAMDDTIKGALGFTPADTGGSYIQDSEGNITVKDVDGKVKSKLNLNILKQKIVEQFHGSGTEKSITEGTQKAIEAGFRGAGIGDLNSMLKKEFKAPAAKTETKQEKTEYQSAKGTIFTADQIKRKAAESGLTVEEYIKQANLK